MRDCIVIGAGHAGLAASHCLTRRSIDHLVLERGEVANSWRTERWDSLTLLTPNWQSRLPGFAYDGGNPDGFMSMDEVVDFIESYARHIDAPVQADTCVRKVTANSSGYLVESDRGSWKCRSLVIASGACNMPAIPKIIGAVPDSITQVTSRDYRKPSQLPRGGVLMVGASATGLQLAEEIHLSGRPVRIAVGEHVRVPRTYRGRDIQWWMDAAGLLDEGVEVVDDLRRVRHLPSPQLVGNPDHQIHDLNRMGELGIGLFGRLMAIQEGRAQFSGSLKNVCNLADLKMNRLLNTIDEWAEQSRDSGSFEPPERFEPTRVSDAPLLSLDLEKEGIRTIFWATGYKPDYSWLDVPVLDRWGLIRHDEGVVTGSPGMVLLGLPFMRKRKSSFIHGVEDDANHVTGHLAQFLA